MKKKLIFFSILILTAFFNIKETYAYSSSNYVNRTLCGSWEVAEFFADGSIVAKSCHTSFDSARAAMVADGGDNLAVLGGTAGSVKIYDANAALVDFTNTSSTIYIYSNSELTVDHTYMNGQSTYGAVDGVMLGTAYSFTYNVFANKVKIGGVEGWVKSSAIEIVPLVWVQSSSSYTISNESIRHNYVSKIQNVYAGSSGNTIGPKPEMLDVGTYYSYDGHYFYKDLLTMVKDYKNGNYNNSINKDKPYYNYYQFLPQHTRTTYSSINIDEYVRNVLGYGRDVYGTTALSKQNIATSRLYGQGAFFYNAQELYGANALLAFGVSRNESGNGRSNLSINKNNGFGLNAVDSNPTEAANYFATFSQSILDYSNVWVNYGYSEPTDWRYNGSQNGNKYVGMNVRYASDVYWGEKMASNYYSMDKAFGLQDYNFYQTAVTTRSTDAKSSPSTSSKSVFTYTSADNGLVIIDEVEGEAVEGNTTWYKVVSDMNIDSNFNQITSGYYNWDSYVYIPAAYVLKTNEGKNGYISPNDVTEYQDKEYTYDLYTSAGVQSPKVAISVKETMYYYDPSLQSAKGQSLLNNRYVMVYATAYDGNKIPVAYLVTSDYKYSQKHWVSADSIKFVTSKYGKASVTVDGVNTYTIVNPTTVDDVSTHISGLYHYAYTPILEETVVDGKVWYKVPVDLSGDNLEFGWTLQSDTDVLITVYQYTADNLEPIITASDKEIVEGKNFDPKSDVTATDAEDGNITEKIEVVENTVDITTPGTYKVTYKVTDTYGISVTKTITVTVIADEKPELTVTDITITLGSEKPELLNYASATDKEDGTINDIQVDDSKVNYNEVGEYEVIFSITDSYGHVITKTIKLIINDSLSPIIYATDKTITIDSEFNELDGVTAVDPEEGDITDKIKVIKNTVDPTIIGTYEVTYQVTDSYNKTTEKTIKVIVSNKEEVEGTFYFDYLDIINDKLQLRGYLTINGMNNTLDEDISYKVIFTDTNDSSKTYEQAATRITDLSEITRPIYSADGYTYTHAWFVIDIDVESLPIGNYTMEVQAESSKYFTKSLVNNKLYKTEVTSYSSTTKNVNIQNNYSNRTSAVTLYIRDKDMELKTVGSYYNQYDVWRVFEFTDDNKLHLKGASYSYGMNLSSISTVKRTIIFENMSTYETYSFDLGSITNGLYTVALPVSDNLDKTRAWYEQEIDLSSIPKGTYKIYITTTSNVTDYSIFSDNLGRDLSSVSTRIGDKTYQFKLNLNDGNNIELEVA